MGPVKEVSRHIYSTTKVPGEVKDPVTVHSLSKLKIGSTRKKKKLVLVTNSRNQKKKKEQYGVPRTVNSRQGTASTGGLLQTETVS